MKIIRMKKRKAESVKDMFVILCLVQSAAVILIILTLFAFTRVNSSALSEIRGQLDVIFGTDLDMGGYFTPSEEKTTENIPDEEAVVTEASEIFNEASVEDYSVKAVENSSAPAVMPVVGTVSSPYGYREHPVYSGESFHSGIDIAAAEGSPIYAVTDGIVTASAQAEMAGKYIKLQHSDGTLTLYCHCSELLVEEGERVKKGDVIALVGQTGLATGPHLHFELHENGEALDPEIILSGAVNVY